MATATKQTVPPTPPVEVIKSVTLVLSPSEANTLAVLCARVAGDRQTSPRKHTNSVLYALNSVGVAFSDTPEYQLVEHNRDGSGFRNYPKGDGFPF